MSDQVGAKLEDWLVDDPLGRPADADPWRDFRHIELLDFPLEFRFRHSFGKVSRFFLELEKRRLMATRCPACGAVWMPPRPICGEDRSVTEWIELSGKGMLAAVTLSAYTLTSSGGETTLALGYVALEGASTLMLQQIRNYGDPETLRPGLALRATWSEAPVNHPMELFWFEPA